LAALGVEGFGERLDLGGADLDVHDAPAEDGHGGEEPGGEEQVAEQLPAHGAMPPVLT
jgi:hypothetical protein